MIEARSAGAFLGTSLLCLLELGAPAGAAPRELSATVVWVRDDRAYLTTRDSTALAERDVLTFVHRGRTLASGVVLRVYDRDLAVARLTSGSLAKAGRLDRLRILAEPPPPPALPALRIGYPARERSGLVLAGDSMTVLRPNPRDAFRVEASAERSYRLVRSSSRADGARWPDTLHVRLFAEAADEEIALERGELDLAVFWPGELSARARENPRWQGGGSGLWAWGVLAATWVGPDSTQAAGTARADSLDLAGFNEEMFRGELMAWPGESGRPPAALASLPSTRSKWWPRPARYVVDPSFPRRPSLQRFLDRDRRDSSAGDACVVRLAYLEAPAGVPDPPAPGEVQASPVFALRCPIVCADALRPVVGALGTDAIVNLIRFEPPGRRP